MSFVKGYFEAISEKIEEMKEKGEEVKAGSQIEVQCDTAYGQKTLVHVVTEYDLQCQQT